MPPVNGQVPIWDDTLLPAIPFRWGDTPTSPVNVLKNGVLVGTRKTVNFKEGANVTITATDDGVGDKVDVEIASSGGGGGAHAIGGVSHIADTFANLQSKVTDATIESTTGSAGKVTTHAGLTTGVHGVGISTVESASGATAKAAAAVATHEGTYAHGNLPSNDEKAALAGTSGAPSVTNKYVTDSDARNSNARTPTAHAHAATDITSGSLDGDRLPALSATKRGGVPATGIPSSTKYLRDDDSWQEPPVGYSYFPSGW